jgi:glutathione S-transferase
MIVAHECALVDRIELIRSVAAMRRPNPALMADNPLNKIPTLRLDDGTVLYDSTVICEYFSDLSGQHGLFPRNGSERWSALRRNALGNGLLDALILWRNERERDQPSPELMAAFETKTRASLGQLHVDLSGAPMDRFDIGDISMGCALAYLDFRFGDLNWRQLQPTLATWFERFSARSSVQATRIVDDTP